MNRSLGGGITRVAAWVKEALGVGVTLGWLLYDHVRRRLTGRPGLFDDLDIKVELDEADVTPPFRDDDGDDHVQQARTKQTARAQRGPRGRR